MDCDEVFPQPSTSTAVNNRSTRQSKISGFTVRPMSITKRAKIDDQLLRFIIKGYYAFNMIECPEFKKLIYLLDRNYDLPSRRTLSDSMLNKLYDLVLEEVRSDIQKNASYICLTTDGWTSLKN